MSEEVRRLAEMHASRADHSSVTADRLAGVADAIADLESPVVAELVEGEEVQFCFESHPAGVSVGEPDEPLQPERGGVLAFTDLRVYLRVGLADGDKVLSLTYDEVTEAEARRTEMGRHGIELRATETVYHLWIPTAFGRDAVARAAEYATYRHKQETPDTGGEEGGEEGGEGDDERSSDSGEPQTVHERLERLGDAKSRGLIDEEEYQRRKERLLRLGERNSRREDE